MSIIFRDGKSAVSDQDSYLLLLNRSRGIYVDPLEALDEDEKIAILQDMLSAESIKNEV